MNPVISIISTLPGDERFHLCAGDAPDQQYLHACLIAMVNDAPVGRLCVYKNQYLKHNNKSILLIGNVGIPDDQQVFDALIAHCAQLAECDGASYLLGPMNGSTWNSYRLPLSNEKAFIGDISCPLYYQRLFLKAGFHVAHRYYSSQAALNLQTVPETEPILNGDVTIRQVNTQSFEEELKELYPLCMSAFEHNVLFSALSKQQFVNQYLSFASFIDPRFVLIAEQQENVIAFLFCYPDHSDAKAPKIVIKTLARHPHHRIPGLIKTMLEMIYYRAFHAGYVQAVHAFMHSDNRSIGWSDRYHGNIIREYVLYVKGIS